MRISDWSSDVCSSDLKKVRTLAKDVAFHPVTDRPLHADFLRVSEHATVHVNVPVIFKNEDASPGLKKGGVLNIVAHEIELIVDAAEIPDDVVIDLAGLDVGDSIHIGAVKLPKGAKEIGRASCRERGCQYV